MRLWIDIDNPPQVQYLLPFAAAAGARGIDVVLTARDYGETASLLRAHGTKVRVVGRRLGRGTLRKGAGSVIRASRLCLYLAAPSRRPDVLLCASRSSALAARALCIPSFVLADYEHASVGVYRLTGSTFLHPETVETATWLRRGLRPEQLRPFRGLKEDISFAAADLDVPAALLPDPELVRILVRPPAEDSHYFADGSRALTLAVLDRLAARSDAQVVFVPRYARQVADVERNEWKVRPIMLTQPLPFVPLLKSVDAVVCSGGTMLREAAYLGVPAYSVLRSEIGGVDRWLASIGRVRLIEGKDDLERIELRKRGELSPLRSNPALLEELLDVMVETVSGRVRGERPARPYA